MQWADPSSEVQHFAGSRVRVEAFWYAIIAWVTVVPLDVLAQGCLLSSGVMVWAVGPIVEGTLLRDWAFLDWLPPFGLNGVGQLGAGW